MQHHEIVNVEARNKVLRSEVDRQEKAIKEINAELKHQAINLAQQKRVSENYRERAAELQVVVEKLLVIILNINAVSK